MNDNESIFFLIEIDYQAKIALAALDELEKYVEEFKNAIRNLKKAQRRTNEFEKVNAKLDARKIRIWLMIQSFLATTANISKIFWPSSKKSSRAEKRGSKLRKKLGVPSNSILEKRTFRNHFEHFDERIDEWAEKDRKKVVDRTIGSLENIQGIDSKEIFRHYNPRTNTITFYKKPYDLEDIKKEIQSIQHKVKQNPLYPLKY